MSLLTDQPRKKRTFAWLSLGMVLVPVAFFVMLVLGGGSSGFKAWNDLVMLLGLMITSAVIGLVFFALSVRRDEQSVIAYFAALVHVLFIVLAVHALLQ